MSFVCQDHPRLRGKDMFTLHLYKFTHRITPAYAGKTVMCQAVCLAIWDHPRLRGKDIIGTVTHYIDEGSPPLTRERLVYL